MFTGLVEEIGTVSEVHGTSIHIDCRLVQGDLRLGDSVAVNGVCLTVVDFSSGSITAEVMPVTFRTTNLGSLRVGKQVNLERAMAMGDRLGGHLVSGHIDAAVRIVNTTLDGDAHLVSIQLQDALRPLIIRKGSVAIDGISLTVADLSDDFFTVSLVGHTKEHTTLVHKVVGELVNIECDQIGKYIQQLLKQSLPQAENKPTLSMEQLKKNGFV